MRIYAVRNEDGQLGIVAASNKVEAVERLDEFANFEGCPIRQLPELMLLLDVDDDGELTLDQIGEEMDEAVRAFAYPLVKQALAEVIDQEESGERDPIDPHERVPAEKERIRKAVDAERERVRRKRTAEPLTERGREVKRYLDLPTSLVRHQENALARAILEGKDVPKDPKKRH
jgi:hypothetical protein